MSVHPSAVVSSQARLGRDVVIGPLAVVEDDTTIGDGCEIRAHAVVKRFTRLGALQPRPRGRRSRRRAAGRVLRRAGDGSRDRRPQPDPRGRHDPPLDPAGRRHRGRLRLLPDGLRARGPRQPRRRPRDPGQQRDAGRPRRDRRARVPGRRVGGPPVLPRGTAGHGRRQREGGAGLPAVRDHRRPPGARPRPERGRPAAGRHDAGPDPHAARGLSPAATLWPAPRACARAARGPRGPPGRRVGRVRALLEARLRARPSRQRATRPSSPGLRPARVAR